MTKAMHTHTITLTLEVASAVTACFPCKCAKETIILLSCEVLMLNVNEQTRAHSHAVMSTHQPKVSINQLYLHRVSIILNCLLLCCIYTETQHRFPQLIRCVRSLDTMPMCLCGFYGLERSFFYFIFTKCSALELITSTASILYIID